MNTEEQVRMARAERIDNAAKQCRPTSQTQASGLEKGDGEVVQFDLPGTASRPSTTRVVVKGLSAAYLPLIFSQV